MLRASRHLPELVVSATLCALALGGCVGVSVDKATAELRPDSPSYPDSPRFDDADDVLIYTSPLEDFRIHYALTGDNAVPTDDEDGSGTPDFVEEVGEIYDSVGAKYRDELGFLPPRSDVDVADNGGDAAFDVYLVDFALRADGAYRVDACDGSRCTGYMVQENDFVDYGYPSTRVASSILASHEYFHAVQAAYDNGQGAVLAEGTAVWATEHFDASLRDFEGFLPSFFERPERSLVMDASGPFETYVYGAAIFFEFLSERFGDDIVRTLLEDCVDGARGVSDPHWPEALDALLAREHDTTFSAAMVEFTRWNVATNARNRDGYGYADARRYPLVNVDDAPAPLEDDSVRVFPASARYYELATQGATEITAALVGDDTDLVVTLVPAMGNDLEEPSDATMVDASGADRVFLILTSTGITGSSRTIGICAGSPDEVDACVTRMEAGEEDAGMPMEDAAMPGEDASVDAGSDGSISAPPDEGCDCGVPLGRPRAGALSLFGIGVLLLTRRRRA